MKPSLTSLFLSLFCSIVLLSCNKAPTFDLEDECKHVVLSDGRLLSYMEYGTADGFPLLYFHGFPGSHKDILLFKGEELAENLQLRLIAVNRPGYAESVAKPGRSLAEWPADVRELTDALDIHRFSILGYSGGGPFALACASEMPERIHRVGFVSGMGPWDAPESKKGMAMTIPRAPKLILNGMAKMLMKKPDKIKNNMTKNMPEVDQEIMEFDLMSEAMLGTIKEGLKKGTQGGIEDARIYKDPWDIELGSIRKTVYLWHGAEDLNVIIETAEFLADQLGHCEPVFMKDEGHLSLIFNNAEDILKLLTEQ